MIQDIPKLYTALSEWLSCMVFVLILKRRFSNKITVLYSALILIILCTIQYLIGIVPLFLWMLGMVLALCVMYLYIYLCCGITPSRAGFVWAFAFIFAEFAASAEWQVSYYLFPDKSDYMKWEIFILMLVFFTAIYGSLYYLQKRRLEKTSEFTVNKKTLVSALLIAICAFFLSNVSYVYENTPFSGSMVSEIFYIRTLVDFAGVVMLMSLEGSILGLQTERERDAIQNILQRQYENYQLSKESIALIHQKHHDLKHQIEQLQMEKDAEKREHHINVIKEGITNFEAQNRTGNAVLDTILTNKQLYCMQHQIELTNVVDGNLLNFMEVMDICSIFGNALDNAIESVEKNKDINKRIIRMDVYKKDDLLLMSFENYYESPLELNGKMPLTTKGDGAYHGYGLKSICNTAEKYGGTAVVSTEDNCFVLRVLIPIPE